MDHFPLLPNLNYFLNCYLINEADFYNFLHCIFSDYNIYLLEMSGEMLLGMLLGLFTFHFV